MDLTEAEDIKKRWQEHIELYKKDLHVPDNHDGGITHLEPDILECEVKWTSVKVKVAQSGSTLCDPWDYTVHGIRQARVLEEVAFPFSRGSFHPRDQT